MATKKAFKALLASASNTRSHLSFVAIMARDLGSSCRQHPAYVASFVPPASRLEHLSSRRVLGAPGVGRARGLLCTMTAAPGDGAGAARAKGLAGKIARLLRGNALQLILHFDLNKTLIMVDPAGGKTQEQVLNSILAEICWGHVTYKSGEPSWNWDGTYSDFLHEMYADAEGRDNAAMKKTRDGRKGSFTEKGQPGFGLRNEYRRLERALALPPELSSGAFAGAAGLAGRDSYYVIPAFFECLKALKEAGAAFATVFRTFGSDVDGVAREHNAFCEGRHPLFPGFCMDGTDGGGDYRVRLVPTEENLATTIGAFYRDEEGIALVMGTLDPPKSRAHLRSMQEHGQVVHSTLADIHGAIEEVFSSPAWGSGDSSDVASSVKKGDRPPHGERPGRGQSSGDHAAALRRGGRRCLALRDYYPFWRSKLETADAGKVLPVEQSPAQAKVWPVMFDDNIGRIGSTLGAHIVDVRDVETAITVSFDSASSRHLIRAEPYLAIITRGNGNYFLAEILRRLECSLKDDASAPAP